MMIEKPMTGSVSRKTVVLFCGLVVLVGLIVWPSLLGRIRYAQTRAELRAIRDAAMVSELSSVGKIFTTLAHHWSISRECNRRAARANIC